MFGEKKYLNYQFEHGEATWTVFFPGLLNIWYLAEDVKGGIDHAYLLRKDGPLCDWQWKESQKSRTAEIERQRAFLAHCKKRLGSPTALLMEETIASAEERIAKLNPIPEWEPLPLPKLGPLLDEQMAIYTKKVSYRTREKRHLEWSDVLRDEEKLNDQERRKVSALRKVG